MTVRQIRYASGLTQKEFSSKYNIPLKTLQNWESERGVQASRTCPAYVVLLLARTVKEDFPNSKNLIDLNIDESHLEAIKTAKAKIRKSKLSEYVKDVLLYGSTARGQAKPTSDVDLLLVLQEQAKDRKKYNDWIAYLKGNISSNDYKEPEADLHVVFGNSWQNSKEAYFINIKNEGFSIWNS